MLRSHHSSYSALFRSKAVAFFIGFTFILATGTSTGFGYSFIDSFTSLFGFAENKIESRPKTNQVEPDIFTEIDPSARPLVSTSFVISQAYGGGGGSTGTYINDYVELKNISFSPQSLNGLSLYYGSATGNFASSPTNAFTLPNITLSPGQFYLVQLGAAGTAGAPRRLHPMRSQRTCPCRLQTVRSPLVTANLPINTCGATATPCTLPNPDIIDLVAWGTAGNAEGGAATNAGASLTSVQGNVRKFSGCQDTDNNNNDFDIVTAPVPRNTANTAIPCGGDATPTATATGTATNTASPTGPPPMTNTATPTATFTPTPLASPSPAQGSYVVISQFYGGGGGTTGTYLNDYVELKNISSLPRPLNGVSLYYGSALGNFASASSNAFALPDVTLDPGQYYLVQLGLAGTAGAPLPVTPDAITTNLNMSGTNGKVAFVNTALGINTCGSTATPCDALQLAAILDWAAYGMAGNGTAGNGEGGTSVNNNVSMTTTQGGVRKLNGCQDTNNNNIDFDVVTAPVPRNSATAPAPCSGVQTPTATNTATPTSTASPGPASFVVNITADTQDAAPGNGICADAAGACSLRAAITEANALAGADTITVPAGTYTQALASANDNSNAGGDFDITSPMTINGAGAGNDDHSGKCGSEHGDREGVPRPVRRHRRYDQRRDDPKR